MIDLQSQYNTRIQFFQDFYKNVKSYKNFDAGGHFEDFQKRKSVMDQKRIEALKKTDILYEESRARASTSFVEGDSQSRSDLNVS